MNLSDHYVKLFWGGVRRGEPDECWPWRTGRDCVFNWIENGQYVSAPVSRVAFHLSDKGPALFGTPVRKTCQTSWCCNPAHLHADEPPEMTVNTYVLINKNAGEVGVTGVRSTLPAAIRLADEGTDRIWRPWQEVPAKDNYRGVRSWVREPDDDEKLRLQVIELHKTGGGFD